MLANGDTLTQPGSAAKALDPPIGYWADLLYVGVSSSPGRLVHFRLCWFIHLKTRANIGFMKHTIRHFIVHTRLLQDS